MVLYDYKMLSEEDQWVHLWAHGEHLENLVFIDTNFTLYALHMFFVEVEVSNDNKIVGKKEFKTGHLLEKWAI